MNYCRQLQLQVNAALEAAPKEEHPKKNLLLAWRDFARSSVKFLLPEGGKLMFDKDLKALPHDKEIRLPYPMIALEWPNTPRPDKSYASNVSFSTKRLLFCIDKEDHPNLICVPFFYFPDLKVWDSDQTFGLSKLGLHRGENGETRYNAGLIQFPKGVSGSLYSDGYSTEGGHCAPDHDGTILLSFLNAIACTNVKAEPLYPRSTGRKVKAPLPFDTYHVLTIGGGGSKGEGRGGGSSGDRHGPREHLRRGHIRRLPSGSCTWVNASIINAGKGGKVFKSYRV